jgi:murein DD-endopeptidase MepM/ murein hydrolase activator NlpD
MPMNLLTRHAGTSHDARPLAAVSRTGLGNPSSYVHSASRWMALALLAIGFVWLPSTLAASPVRADAGCPVTAQVGAISWLLASMPGVDFCDLLSAGIASAPPEPTTAAPAPSEHTVVEGETLSEIALLYGTTAEALAALNGLDDVEALSIGMRLRLRDGAEATQEPTAESPVTAANVVLKSACTPEVSEHVLDLPAEASRVATLGGTLYLVAGGDLFGLPMAEIAATDRLLQPVAIQPRDRKVEGILLQELMDIAVDETSAELVLLNKVGDLFGYQPASGRWSVRMVAASVHGLWIDPQYLAITQIGAITYALDADNASVWRLSAGATYPALERSADSVARAVDLAAMNGTLYLAQANGTLVDDRGQAFAPSVQPLTWPADLTSAQGGLLALDGDGRRIVLLGEDGAVDVTVRVPGMQRLRTATAADGIAYAVAGHTLYRVSALQDADTCAAVPYDDRWLFNNINLDEGVPALTLPFDGGVLPSRPRSYPGARRMYRFGIHEGVDFYSGDAPGLSYGSPVAAIAAGTVIRIDHDFAEITPEAYGPIMAEISQLHSTPDYLLDKLRGRQVWVEHAPGIVSRYSHLSRTTADLQVGDAVETGQILGRVGTSGTSDGVYGSTAGYHLHWEIWIHGRYLGQGLTIPETMRIWNHLF